MGERAYSFIHIESSSATLSAFKGLRPEALRPNLSEGLPFSKSPDFLRLHIHYRHTNEITLALFDFF